MAWAPGPAALSGAHNLPCGGARTGFFRCPPWCFRLRRQSGIALSEETPSVSRMLRLRHSLCLVLAVCLLGLLRAENLLCPPTVEVVIEPTSTTVFIASVSLRIEGLRLHGDRLVGRYSIRVPLRPSKNESGQIILPLTRPWDDTIRGGLLEGLARADHIRHPRKILCEVFPAAETDRGRIRLAIDTGDHVLNFSSNYRLLALPMPESLPPVPAPLSVPNPQNPSHIP